MQSINRRQFLFAGGAATLGLAPIYNRAQSDEWGWDVSDSTSVWTKYPENPVLKRTEPYEQNGISEAEVESVNGQLVMLYGAKDSSELNINFALSDDGPNWNKHDSNPVVEGFAQMSYVYVNGKYQMYATNQSTYAIHYFTSADAIDWTDHGPVITPGESGEWDNGALFNTCSIVDGPTRYVWYEVSSGAFKIGLAVGDGPQKLQKIDGPVLEPGGTEYDTSAVYNPEVVLNDGRYFMYHGAASDDGYQTALATSPDGIHFTKQKVVLSNGPEGAWDSVQAMDPSIVRVKDEYLMYYKGAPGAPSAEQDIGLAKASVDAIADDAIY